MASAPFRLAKALRMICDFFMGATILGTAGYLAWFLWLAVSPVFFGPRFRDAHIPVSVGYGPPGLSLPVTIGSAGGKSVQSAGVYGAGGELLLRTDNVRIQALGYLDDIVFSLLILGLAYYSRQFLVDIIGGSPFTLQNARRLKRIGWFLLAISLVNPVVGNITARLALPIVNIQSPVLSPPILLDFPLILVALFVLILAAAFRHGVELEQEHSLTV